jgi:fumarate reductase flavoprotein subunit
MTGRTRKILTVSAGIVFLLMILFGCDTSKYKAGTYRAAGNGYSGSVMVEVEFDGKSILSVSITEENETKEFAASAIGVLPGKIVTAQTYDVDTVTSATITSNAIKEAVKDCMEQAAAR